ncbi:MAG: hypothetical protein ACM3PP_07115 [Candidatus Saccharibacteria bacterium]
MEVLLDLYEQEKSAFQEMLQVSDDQLIWALTEDHNDESFAQFQTLLDKRQNLIHRINKLVLKIKDLQATVTVNDGGTFTESEKIRQYNDMLLGLATNIKARDDECDAILKRNVAKMKQKISNFKRSQNAAKAYFPQDYQDEGLFYDRRK